MLQTANCAGLVIYTSLQAGPPTMSLIDSANQEGSMHTAAMFVQQC